MAKNTLPVNYKDDILNSTMDGKRRYRMITNSDGTVSFEDVTTYDQVGSNFGAAQLNAANTAVNASADSNKIIDDLSTIAANTQEGYMAGALAVKELNQSLIPNYETTKTVLSDNSKASYTKKYVVNKDSWFACDHQSYNGYSWGNVFVNDIRVAGFRAMPIDEAHYAYSSTTFFAPKGSTIIINGAGGMTVNVSEIG